MSGACSLSCISLIQFDSGSLSVLLKIPHRGAMMYLMVDSPLDQMSLVRFRAHSFRTI